MKSKSEIIATVDPKKTYIGSFVIERIREVDCDDSYPPEFLRKGDVIVTNYSGTKSRPSVIIKVLKDKVIAIPLTSNKNVHSLCEHSSRFFSKGYFCNAYIVMDTEVAKSRFVGVYDNPKAVNRAIKELKEFVNINL